MAFLYQEKQTRTIFISSLLSRVLFGTTFVLFSFALVFAADARPIDTHPTTSSIFASVNGEDISIQEFQSAFRAGMRKRFYHGKIPQEKLQEFRQEVSQTLIDRVLLVEEARRLHIAIDEKKIATQLSQYEKRYADKPFWKNNKEQVLPGLRKALEDESLMSLIAKRIKNVPLPSVEAAEEFYGKNPELFTTPEKMRVSLILLKVSPASPGNVWEAAKKEAEDIIERLNKGADFRELARIHSGDGSASNGGDMGFIHQGMLAEPAQKALDKLSEGQFSDAVMSLRGVAIFRLDKKQIASLNKFDTVVERAKKLLQRENAKVAWSALLEKLRANANIEVNRAILAVSSR